MQANPAVQTGGCCTVLPTYILALNYTKQTLSGCLAVSALWRNLLYKLMSRIATLSSCILGKGLSKTLWLDSDLTQQANTMLFPFKISGLKRITSFISVYNTMCSILYPGKGEEQQSENHKLGFFD